MDVCLPFAPQVAASVMTGVGASARIDIEDYIDIKPIGVEFDVRLIGGATSTAGGVTRETLNTSKGKATVFFNEPSINKTTIIYEPERSPVQ